MSDNPNFVPTFSTDEVYVAQDVKKCLSDELLSFAKNDHSHDGVYLRADHTHNEYALKDDMEAVKDLALSKAERNHVHTEYAPVDHVHNNYATENELYQLTNIVGTKTDVGHTHPEYALEENLERFKTDFVKFVEDLANKANREHYHDDRYYTEPEIDEMISTNISSVEYYVDYKIADLLENSTEAVDSIMELKNAMESNKDAIEALNVIAGAKANASDFNEHKLNKANPHNVTLSQLGVKATNDEINNVIGITGNIQDQLNNKANNSHTHNVENVIGLQLLLDSKANSDHTHKVASVASDGMMSKDDKAKLDGIDDNANNYVLPSAGSTLGGVQTGGDVAIVNGVITVNDDSHNHIIGNVDGLQSALDNKINKSLQITKDSGDAKFSWTDQDVIANIKTLEVGLHTVYAKTGTKNNPKPTESWRFFIHKTSPAYGWVQAFGSTGSYYVGYLDNNNWKGWRCVFDVSPEPLWKGASYMSSPNSTPQVVTPSKKLSECQHGWLLLWSDYDPGKGANDADFVTTMIPKKNPAGGAWGGKSFLCDIPRYVGDDNVATEKRIMKPIYVHDDCIKGSYQNDKSERNDVVLRAVYEY